MSSADFLEVKIFEFYIGPFFNTVVAMLHLRNGQTDISAETKKKWCLFSTHVSLFFSRSVHSAETFGRIRVICSRQRFIALCWTFHSVFGNRPKKFCIRKVVQRTQWFKKYFQRTLNGRTLPERIFKLHLLSFGNFCAFVFRSSISKNCILLLFEMFDFS